jgi:hypothetical protein
MVPHLRPDRFERADISLEINIPVPPRIGEDDLYRAKIHVVLVYTWSQHRVLARAQAPNISAFGGFIPGKVSKPITRETLWMRTQA